MELVEPQKKVILITIGRERSDEFNELFHSTQGIVGRPDRLVARFRGGVGVGVGVGAIANDALDDVGGLFTRRVVACGARTGASTYGRSIASRAFMSTSAEIFSAPSFPVKTAPGFEGTDPSVWLQQYSKANPAEMWAVGSFPVQQSMTPVDAIVGTDDVNANGTLRSSEDLWDTWGMLSTLAESVPLHDDAVRGVDEILQEMDRVYGYYADSVLKKRRKKMNKHKHRKRKKAQRMRTKKN